MEQKKIKYVYHAEIVEIVRVEERILNNFENDKIKVVYYGGVIESIQAFVDGYKNAVKLNGELLSIEYLDFLANETISHAEDMLNSFELGRGYLKQAKQS